MIKPSISILLVSYQSELIIEQTIQHFLEVSPPVDTEIIVVDNASEDRTRDILRHRFSNHPQVSCIFNNSNNGFGSAMNLAAKKSQGKFILIANLDIVMETNILKNALKYLQSHPEAGGVSPKIIDHGEVQVATARRYFSLITLCIEDTFLSRLFPSLVKKYISLQNFNPSIPQPIPVSTGCFLLMSKELYIEIGGFDESFFLYFEDIDLTWRIFQIGKPVHYLPEICIQHNSCNSSHVKTYFRRKHWHRAIFLYSRKHLGDFSTFVLAGYRFCDIGIRLIISRFLSLMITEKTELANSHAEILEIIANEFNITARHFILQHKKNK